MSNPAAEAVQALKPIRDLHKPLTIIGVAANCGAEICDHEDACPEDTPIIVCAECWAIAELVSSYYGEEGIDDQLLWPCHTAELVYATEDL